MRMTRDERERGFHNCFVMGNLESAENYIRELLKDLNAAESDLAVSRAETEHARLHPGLGSGALREALAKIASGNWSYSECVRLAAEALSLSSPIEPRERELESLIVHMWIHSGYTKNGYQQMTTPQKALYDSLVGRSEEIAERDMPQTAVMRERAQASSEIREALERVSESLQGILDIGKRDMSNPKYDGYFETATNALANYRALSPSRQGAGGK